MKFGNQHTSYCCETVRAKSGPRVLRPAPAQYRGSDLALKRQQAHGPWAMIQAIAMLILSKLQQTLQPECFSNAV